MCWLFATAFRTCTELGCFFFCGQTFFFLDILESLSRNRKSDVLFTGLSAWESTRSRVRILVISFFSSVFVVAGMRYVAVRWLYGCQGFFVLFHFDMSADPFSSSFHGTRVEVLTPQLLCLAVAWLNGLLFLPLCDYSLIMVSSSALL